MRILTPLVLVPLLLATACGGGGGGGGSSAGTVPAAPATTEVTTYYTSGRLATSGRVITGTSTRHGGWIERFDVDGNPLRWQGSYANGAVDAGKPWTEWNADGSVRIDGSDH